MSDESEDQGMELVTPFYIDTDGYTDRDRQMFTCGVEFQIVAAELETGDRIDRVIHRENASRIRMLCGLRKRVTEKVLTGRIV